MIVFRNILFFSIILLYAGCKTETNNTISYHNLKTISIKTAEDKFLNDTLISSLSVVPLETTQNSLIGSIYKFVSFGDRFYIQDLRNQTLFVFTNNGKFLFKLSEGGRGPGEFNELRNFQIADSGDIYLLTYRKIMHYSPDGKYLDDFPFDFVNATKGFNLNPTNFIRINKDEYFLYGGTVGIENNDSGLQYALYRINGSKEITGKYFKLKRRLIGGNRFYRFGDYFYMKPIDDDADTIYRIDENGLSAAWYVDFGKHAVPEKYLPKDFTSARHNLIETSYCRNIDNIFETREFLYFFYFQGRNTKNVFYSKKSGQVIHGNLQLFGCFNPLAFIGTHKDQLVCSVEPYLIINALKSNNFSSCLPDLPNKPEIIRKLLILKETDNPVLFLVTFKKF